MLADIFPGREHYTDLIHTRQLAEAMALQPYFAQAGKQIIYAGNVEDTANRLRRILRSGDLAIIMGAGDIYRVTEMLIQEAQAQENLL